MRDVDDLFLAPFRQMLASIATPTAVRAAEAIRGVPPMWAEIESSGFLDALVPEENGGAGLSLADIFPLIAATGEFALRITPRRRRHRAGTALRYRAARQSRHPRARGAK